MRCRQLAHILLNSGCVWSKGEPTVGFANRIYSVIDHDQANTSHDHEQVYLDERGNDSLGEGHRSRYVARAALWLKRVRGPALL